MEKPGLVALLVSFLIILASASGEHKASKVYVPKKEDVSSETSSSSSDNAEEANPLTSEDANSRDSMDSQDNADNASSHSDVEHRHFSKSRGHAAEDDSEDNNEDNSEDDSSTDDSNEEAPRHPHHHHHSAAGGAGPALAQVIDTFQGGVARVENGQVASTEKANQMGDFFLRNLGFFVPFLIPGMAPGLKKFAGGLPPPLDYLLRTQMGANGIGVGPTQKVYTTCPPKMPPPFNRDPPPPPPLFPVQTKMPDWGLLVPGSTSAGMHKFDPNEPDGWYVGEVKGRFTPPSGSGTGKVVEKYPTQGQQYPLSAGSVPPAEPLAHLQSPAVADFQQPGIWLELASRGTPTPPAPRGVSPTLMGRAPPLYSQLYPGWHLRPASQPTLTAFKPGPAFLPNPWQHHWHQHLIAIQH